jgi:hypothetical protein
MKAEAMSIDTITSAIATIARRRPLRIFERRANHIDTSKTLRLHQAPRAVRIIFASSALR